MQLQRVQEKINLAARRVNRDSAEITLVAVSKTHPLELLLAAHEAGLRHFGENRVEESCQKAQDFASQRPDLADAARPQWHFIGHLQKRQVSSLLEQPISLFHGLDSLKLAERIQRIAERDNFSPLNVLLQCNVSGEEAKSGFELASWEESPQQLETFINQIERMATMRALNIQGLMTMAPYSDKAEDSRPVFQRLARLRRTLQERLPAITFDTLSMGMTNDFEVAIEEGSTMVRIGRAIFGERS